MGGYWYGFLIVDESNWDTLRSCREKFEKNKAYVMRTVKVSEKQLHDLPPWEEIHALTTKECNAIQSLFNDELVHRCSFGIDWLDETDIPDEDVYLACTCRKHFEQIVMM